MMRDRSGLSQLGCRAVPYAVKAPSPSAMSRRQSTPYSKATQYAKDFRCDSKIALQANFSNHT